MPTVLCVGHASWDVIARVAELPAENTKCEASSLSESGGGPAANAAYLLAKWRISTALGALIGRDRAGERMLQEFRDVSLDTSPIQFAAQTATSLILVSEKSGHRTIVTHKPFSMPLTLAPELSPPEILLFDGHELNASLDALERFPQAQCILDAGSLREGTRVLAEQVDFLVASERFSRQITGLDDLKAIPNQREAISRLSRLNGNRVVITLGEKGLIYGTDTEFESIPAIPVRSIDTTAAGDIFHGAFAYGLTQKWDWLPILRFATIAAGISVTRSGGRASIPTLQEVEAIQNQTE